MKNLIYLITLKPSSHRTAEENLGIQYLASMLSSSGYRVKIRDAWLDDTLDDRQIEKKVLSEKEDVLFVGTSSYMLNNGATCDLINKLSNYGIDVVSGGFGPTFEPEMFLNSGAKLVMVGEGENTIVEVAKYFQNPQKKLDEIDGILFNDKNQLVSTRKRKVVKDLDNIPFPQRPYLDKVLQRHSTVNVLTSRGCMGHCNFCSISAFQCRQNSLRWRGRTIDNIIDELEQLKERGVKVVKFVDDSFLENERNEKWCEDFLDAVKKSNLNMAFRASIRADKVNDEIIKLLKKAGFFSFSCGIENGSKTALKRMAKLATVDDNICALKVFKKNKIYVQAGFILFDDKTTMTELKENYKFLRKFDWMISKGIFSEMYAAAGTTFTNSIEKSEQKFNSNSLYLVKDIQARHVYDYLKKWQLHHSKIYDMVIDPISAPKAMEVVKMQKYFKLMKRMKSIDLKFFKSTILAVENGKSLNELFLRFEKKYGIFFEKIKTKVQEFYLQDDLKYDANINGFLNANIQIDEKVDFKRFVQNSEILQKAINFIGREANQNESTMFLKKHILVCAKMCYEQAQKQELDPTLAVLIGIFHDYGKLKKDLTEKHEIYGSKVAKEFLENNGFDVGKINIVCVAIQNHKQDANDEEMDEYSKMIIDCDILSYFKEIEFFKGYLCNVQKDDDWQSKIVIRVKKSLARLDQFGKNEFLESENISQILNVISPVNKVEVDNMVKAKDSKEVDK